MTKSSKIQSLLSKSHYNFDDLRLILEILRGEGGCPWDAEQTHQSIRKNLIEETYEVIEAIDTNDSKLMREELGDVLLQVVFHAQIERELEHFTIDDVANDVCAKLIHRHPHIFADVSAETSDEVLKNWEAIKNAEKSRNTTYDKLNSIPPMMPALMRAQKVAKKSGEYKSLINSEIISNIKDIVSCLENSPESIKNTDIGELLFAITALCGKCDMDAEEALYSKTNTFIESYKNNQ